jgi:hypothetical protein
VKLLRALALCVAVVPIFFGCGQQFQIVDSEEYSLAQLESVPPSSETWIRVRATLQAVPSGEVWLVDQGLDWKLEVALAENTIYNWQGCIDRKVVAYGYYRRASSSLLVDMVVLDERDAEYQLANACVAEVLP